MKDRLVSILFLFSISIGYSQSYTQNKMWIQNLRETKLPILPDSFGELKVGQKVPEIFFKEILNFPEKQAMLSGLLKKPTIFDFWFTACPVCIQQFPKLASFQKKYENNLQIFTVGFDFTQKGSIKKYVSEKVGKPNAIKLPVIVQGGDETIMNRLFPTISFPLEVWIDTNGIVKAITDHMAVTEENLSAFTKSPATFSLKPRKKVKAIDCNTSVLIGQNNSTGSFRFGSAITAYNDSLTNYNYWGHQCDSNYLRYFELNMPIHTLYDYAYKDLLPELELYPYNKLIFIDTVGLNRPFYADFPKYLNKLSDIEFDEFAYNNLFCYEIIAPKNYSYPDILRFMRADLDRFFQVKSKVQKRKIKCWVLKQHPKLKPNPHPTYKFEPTNTDSTYRLFDDLNTFTYQLNMKFKELIVNRSGLNSKLLLDLNPREPRNLLSWNEALLPYGLTLIETEEELSFVYLTPNDQ